MTENEAIEALRLINTSRVHPFYSWEEMAEVMDIAISALKEVQQYRKIGTVEQVKNQKENLNVAYQIISDYEQYGTVEEFKMAQRYMRLVNAHGTIGQVIDSCAEYEEIGTVKECREAVEKQKPMKATDIHVDEYFCPACGAENCCDQGIARDRYCPNCGQAVLQENKDD